MSSYSVTIHFSAGDKTYTILRNGWVLPQTVGAKGKHATQSLNLSIKSAEAFAYFMTETQKNIRAEVKKDDATIFSGIVRPYLTTSASGVREDAVSMEILDYTELLHYYVTADEVISNKTLDALIDDFFSRAGISSVSRTYPSAFSSDNTYYVALTEGDYLDTILSTILYERGYDYRFTATGCEFFETTTESAPTETITDIRGTLSVQREDDWNEGISVTYPKAKEDFGITIYKHSRKETEPAKVGGTGTGEFPWGTTYYNAKGLYYDSAQHKDETTPQDGHAYVSWDVLYNESTKTNIKLIGLDQIQISAWMDDEDGVTLTTNLSDVTFSGGRLWLKYSGNFDQHTALGFYDWTWVWNVEVKAHVTYLLDDSVEIASIDGQRPQTKESLSYTFTEAKAQAYVQREFKRQKTSSFTYTFSSLTAYSAGKFYQLQDGVTGINQVVRILSCSQGADGIYTIKAESASTMSISDIGFKKLYYSDMESTRATAFKIIASQDTLQVVTDVANLSLSGVIALAEGMTFKWTLGDAELTTGKNLTVYYKDLSAGANTITCTAYLNGEQMAQTTCRLVRIEAEGAKGDSVEVQYAYSESFTELKSGDTSWGEGDIFWGDKDVTWITWSTIAPAEKEGYYIWIRTRVGNGEWQYSRLTGAHAQLCEITCDKSVVIRNDRLTTSEVYTFTADIQGYINKTVKIYLNGEDKTSVCTKNGHKYILVVSVPHANATSMTAIVCLDDVEMDSVTLTLVNETDYFQFQGTMTSAEAEALAVKIKGDTYVDTDNNTIMYYNGQNWQAFSLSLLDTKDASMAGQILSSAEEAYWKLYSTMTDEQKTELFKLYGYKSEVISRFIASEKIQMYGDGVIASSSVSTDPSETIDSKGFLTEQGYRFEGLNGIARVNTAYLSSVYIDAFSKIFGEIQSEALATHNGAYVQSHFKSNTTKNTKYWSYNDLYNAMRANAIISTSGNFEGNTVSKYAKITDSNAINATRYLRWLQVRSKTSTDGGSGYDKISIVDGSIAGQTLSATYTNTTAYTQTMLLSYDLYNGGITTYDLVELTATVNGSKVASISTVSTKKGSTSFSLASGATVTVTLKCDGYTDEVLGINGWYASGSCGLVLQPSSFFSVGITSLGAWLYYGSAWHKLSEAGYKSTSLNLLGVTNEYITWEDNCYEVIDGVMQSEPTASGGYASLDTTSRVQASDGTDFVPELVSWNSKAISFSNSNGKFLMINKQKWFKSFSFTLDVTASSSYTKTANLTPKETTTTIGNEDEPFNAVYAKAVFVQNASGEWVKIEV